jgi:hypothetical protein
MEATSFAYYFAALCLDANSQADPLDDLPDQNCLADCELDGVAQLTQHIVEFEETLK